MQTVIHFERSVAYLRTDGKCASEGTAITLGSHPRGDLPRVTRTTRARHAQRREYIFVPALTLARANRGTRRRRADPATDATQ